MKKYFSLFQKIFTNEAFLFVVGKYFAFGLQFLNSILIAHILGPYYFGIYGFVLLVVSYVRFANFGVHYAVNVELSTHDRTNKQEANQITSMGFMVTIGVAVLILLAALSIHFLDIQVFEKYDFSQYLLLTVFISISLIMSLLFTNIYRSYSKFYQILAYFILPQLFLLIMLYVGPENEKLNYLLYGFLGGHVIALLVFIKDYPLKFSFTFSWRIFHSLIKRGIPLVIYNASFYFILLSARTIVSIFYDVESMGLFSFANNVAQASEHALGVISFVFFPKILNRLKTDIPNHDAIELLAKIRSLYLVVFYLIMFSLVFVYGILVGFMESYQFSELTFLFLILMKLFIGKVFGYSHLLVSRGYENKIAAYAFITVLLATVSSIGFIYFYQVDFTIVAVCTFISTAFYMLAVIRKGKIVLHNEFRFFETISELFPLRYLIPLVLLILERIFIREIVTSVLPLIVFVLLNWKSVKAAVIQFLKVFSNINYVKF
ncbi:MAG: oligosaccharide flippase family protein [Salinivirgaceae bacterium]|jgi:O-antigen/teichoic acid export membrane protein|nr:oligosaccharide flippase family protein [Salinivirgaceae bacterium]